MTLAWREDTSDMDRLDQLYARSLHEIEARTDNMSSTETGRYLIDQAAHLLAALRLWAQRQYRSDQVVRGILDAPDVGALHDVANELREGEGSDGETASWTIASLLTRPTSELIGIASYARRAL